MTYCEWEKELLGYLKSLPESEKKEITEYYREMYGDKSDAGMSAEEILSEFGEAKVCAARILLDSAQNTESDENGNSSAKSPEQEETKIITVLKTNCSKYLKNISVAKIVGWFFLGILVIIPLAAIAVSVIASFAAAAISGAAAAIGGVFMGILAPFGLIVGYTGSGALATAGVGLASAGVGAIIAVAFFWLTKYSVISCWKIIKYFFKRSKEQ